MNNPIEALDHVRLNFSPESLIFLNIALAFVMSGVALDIKFENFADLVRKPKSAIVGFVSQTFLLPALTFVMVILLNPTPTIALGMILVAACPGGNISNFISSLAKGNVALSVSLSAILIFFVLMVVSLFTANFTQFMTYINLVFFFVLLQNGVAMTSGYFFSSLFKCSQKDKRTIAIETGIQNSGLALALMFNPKIFPPDRVLGGMAIIAAWWGIWHIISGLTVSWYWSRRPVIVQL